jgi:Fe-S oxidoreductase
MGGEFEVLHYTQYLQELSSIGKLDLNDNHSGGREFNGKRVAYHDSCYLGRYNDVFEAPRKLLDLTGTNRFELERKGENSFCCGAGGGGMWVETDPDTRINQARLKQALDAETDIVATACPYCLIMFDDAVRSKGVGEEIQIVDIAEILVNGNL